MATLTITYLGQCGFLLDFGAVRIVTDPYLSDSVDRLYATPETPWRRAYPAPRALFDLMPDAVLISHDHGDHLDPDTLIPYVRAGGRAVIAAPAPVCAALGEMLPPDAPPIAPARAERPFDIGPARITPVACAHTQLHTDDMGRFYELSYIIRVGDQAVFFGGDMSLYDGLTERLRAEGCRVLLLPANGRDEARTAAGIVGNTDCAEAAELAAALDAPLYIPMHHDLYAINGCADEDILAAAARAGARVKILKPMEAIEV